MTYDRNFLENFDGHWFGEGYNLGILSAFVKQSPNISKMIELFSLNIWSHILISTLVITLFNTINGRFEG